MTEPENAPGTTLVPVPTEGRFAVHTESSTHLVDLDARTITRVPDTGMGAGDRPGMVITAQLRRDHETLPLRELLVMQVGAPLVAVLDLRGDGIPTLRQTTLVREIQPLETQ